MRQYAGVAGVAKTMKNTSHYNSRPIDSIDRLLLAAIALLILMLAALLAWPVLTTWVNRPRPGVQVAVARTPPSDSQDEPAPLDYLLCLPKTYMQDKSSWPLVLFLHGAGERGNEIRKVARTGPPLLAAEGRDFPMILVSPQCPPHQGWRAEILLKLIDHVAAQYRVDPQRIYVTGYSMGGFGTWDLTAAAPDRFAAAAPLCGGGAHAYAERLKHLPLWVFHGEVDNVVPIESSQNMVDAVRAAGGDVRFTVYPGEGHGICDRTYARDDFWQWLLEQQRENSTGEPRSQAPSE